MVGLAFFVLALVAVAYAAWWTLPIIWLSGIGPVYAATASGLMLLLAGLIMAGGIMFWRERRALR